MIELQNLSKFYYSDSSVTIALKKINLKLPDRGFIAITGESGSGKTTLLSVISGQLPYDEGEMLVDGERTFQYDDEDWENYRKERIGYVFQDYSLLMNYTALDNVMSVMIIMHKDIESARRRAEKYLEKVGLLEYAKHKARELSSGQKQRLSIARALAKETEILVADEPTGNLDSETGEQIIKLLKELSEEKLVLLVTHNYQQAEKYVDRKIRMHDGEIVKDQCIRDDDCPDLSDKAKAENKTEDNKAEDGGSGGDTNTAYIIKYFVRKNILARKGRSAFFLLFFLLVAAVAFVFLGDFLTQLDETNSKEYDDNYFLNEDDTRLCVIKDDRSTFTDADMEELLDVKDVVSVDRYDFVQDINYYAEESIDYEVNCFYDTVYTEVPIEGEEGAYEYVAEKKEFYEPSFMDKTHFMRSASALNDKELKEGRIPEKLGEIAVSEDYALKLGDDVSIYFTADNLWNDEEFYNRSFKVTGIVTSDEKQIYFSNDLCRMFGAYMVEGPCIVEYGYDMYHNTYDSGEAFKLVINEDMNDSENGYPYDTAMGINSWPVTISSYAQCSNQILDPMVYGYGCRVTLGDKKLHVDITQNTNTSSGLFLEVTGDLFYSIYSNDDSHQATVYINNYARSDKVIKRLEGLGYRAVSTYRSGCVRYDDKKTNNRFTRIGIGVAVLSVLALFEILVIGFAMRIHRKDYQVIGSIGMEKRNVRRLVYYELLIYSVLSVFAVAAVSTLLMYLFSHGVISNKSAIAVYISNMLYYFTIPSMVFYLAYILILQAITGKIANALMGGGRRS